MPVPPRTEHAGDSGPPAFTAMPCCAEESHSFSAPATTRNFRPPALLWLKRAMPPKGGIRQQLHRRAAAPPEARRRPPKRARHGPSHAEASAPATEDLSEWLLGLWRRGRVSTTDTIAGAAAAVASGFAAAVSPPSETPGAPSVAALAALANHGHAQTSECRTEAVSRSRHSAESPDTVLSRTRPKLR